MSKFGWRWWDIGRDGALESVNGVVWPPDEPLKAEHEFGYGDQDRRHRRWIEKDDGTLVPLPEEWTTSEHDGYRLPGMGTLRIEQTPASKCVCGYWAFWDPELASGLPMQSPYHRTTKVFGVIEAWGEIVECELGFLAEWVIPRAVCVTRGRLHDAYNMMRYHSFEDMIQVWDDGGTSEVSGEVIEIIDPDLA